jgi:hypothetical protein
VAAAAVPVYVYVVVRGGDAWHALYEESVRVYAARVLGTIIVVECIGDGAEVRVYLSLGEYLRRLREEGEGGPDCVAAGWPPPVRAGVQVREWPA